MTGAQKLFRIGIGLYNGTGFIDQSFNTGSGAKNQYQTFKLALYIITAIKLNETIPLNMIVTLGRMENAKHSDRRILLRILWKLFDWSYSHEY
jgi:hypothetical protein